MRKRIVLLFIAAAAILTAAMLAPPASGPALRTVVVLTHASVSEQVFDSLRRELAELGWREDESIRFIKAPPQTEPEQLRAQAKQLITPRVALIVALSTPAALAARDAAAQHGVPILMAPASDPVAAGLVSGTTHPGQALTGIAFATQEARRLEMLKLLAPGVRRVWFPYDASDPSPAAALARLQGAAAKLDITLVPTDIRSAAQLHAALDSLPRDMDAIFIPPDARIASTARAITLAATARGIPVTIPHREGVALGALFSYGFDLNALGRQAARLADQILSGIPAADLPIETADMDLTINLAVADRLGLRVPDELLRHADIVGQAGE